MKSIKIAFSAGFMAVSASLYAQTAPVIPSATDIAIVRKSGHDEGIAQIVIKGKVHKITGHAIQAWLVREGQGALILVDDPKASPRQYRIRYFDLDSGRRRDLGAVPFKSASMTQSKDELDPWAFSLTGNDLTTNVPITVVGDDQAIPGVLCGATSPVFDGDNFLFTSGGRKHTEKTADLLGTDLRDIYSAPQGSIPTLQYLQVFPSGTAMTMSPEGVVQKGTWHTDGEMINLAVGSAKLEFDRASLERVKGVPAGTRFSVRLLQPLSSRTAKEGMTIDAINITPVVVDGEILIPEGSSIAGTVTKANGVGWGFKHETASLTIAWNRVTLNDGRTLPITARVFEVENAQEKTTANGKIQGIRSTATPGNSVENDVLTFAGIDPIAYIFASASGSSDLGFAEPEILYHAGTELVLEYTKPVITAQSYPPSVPTSAQTTEARQQLQDFIRTIPFRTRVKGSNKVSDLTNLIFIGDPQALQRAFLAAGWLPTDDLNSTSTFKTLKTLSGNQTYTQAPMSILLLDERAPIFALSKTTNTFSSRHHVRVFPTEEKWKGVTVATASSTQDIGIAFSRKQKTFIHVIDQHLDNERSKIVDDLEYTGCVDSIDMIPRPWLPSDAFNSTGDHLITDRDAAVLHINSCTSPITTPSTPAPPPNRLERITRDTSLSIRNNIYRGNLIYQGISGGIGIHKYLSTRNDLPEDFGVWRKDDSSGATYAPLRDNTSGTGNTFGLSRRRRPPAGNLDTDPEDLAAIAKIKKSHKWDPPRYEFALEGGNMFFRGVQSLSAEDIQLISDDPGRDNYELILTDLVNSGWSAGGTVTVNSWRHFSNEFSYFRQQGKYELDSLTFTGHPGDTEDDEDLDTQRVGIATRQFEYNVLAQARPPASRWRPYIAAGPVLQLIALANSPLKKPAGVFTLGLKNVGLIKAAFDFGNTPALDGGGVFRLGLQYGAGIKYRITPHVILRADYRETWSKNPDLIKSSYIGYESPDVDSSYTTDVLTLKPVSKFLQDRFTLGIAFAF
jgi:opacity protein-like surface antigen